MKCYPFLDPCNMETIVDIQPYLREKKDFGKFNPEYPWPGVERRGAAPACP